MIYLILDNIFNTKNITNGIFFRYNNLIDLLIKNKVHVTLITRYVKDVQLPKSKYFSIIYINFIRVPFYEELYIPCILNINNLKKNSTLITLLEYPTIFLFLPNLIKKYNLKIIIGYHTRIDLYLKEHYSILIYYLYKILENLYYLLKPKLILSSGYALKKILKKKFICPIEVWYQMNSNFLDLENELPLYTKNEPITLIYTGRLAKEKNVYELFKIQKYFIKKYGEAKLILIGNGPELINIKKKIMTNSNIIIVRGLIENNKLPEEYNKYENPFFIFPSRSEALGKSVIEASLCGIPVITAISDETKYLYKDKMIGYTYKNIKECCKKISIFIKKTQTEKNEFLINSKNHFRDIFKDSTNKIINKII